MQKSVCIILLIALVSGAFTFLGVGAASTAVSGGYLYSNTNWSQDDSPYQLMGDLTITQGCTLTIQDGVTLDLNGYTLTIDGTLKAQGTVSNKICFTSNYSGAQIMFSSSSTSATVTLLYRAAFNP
jgi:hypothetical protein